MAVAEMRRVTIVGHQSLLDSVMSTLQRLEVLQVDDVAETLSPEGTTLFTDSPPSGNSFVQLEEQAARVRSALDLLDQHFRAPRGVIETFAGVRYAVEENEYRRWAGSGEHTATSVSQAQELKERLRRLQVKYSTILEDLEALSPWQALDVAVAEVSDTQLFRVQLGEIAVNNAQEFAQELEAVTPAAGYEVIAESRDGISILLYYPRKYEEQLQASLRDVNWTPAVLPSTTSTVAETIVSLEKRLQTIAAEQEEAISAVSTLVEERLALYAREDELRNHIEREETKSLLGYTSRLFVMRGWARLRDIESLRLAMSEVSPAIVVEDEPPGPDEPHPVDIENPRVIRPFEVVTRVAGLPQPGALDPTPFLAPFFFIFFGLALGDAGYGIVLSILSLWLARRANAVGLGLQLMHMLAICGISTVVAGALTGSWFGDLLGIPPLWFSPMENPLPLLVLSIGLGVIQIFAGLAIKGYDSIRKGHLFDAICDQGLWLVFLTGLVLLLVAGYLPQWPHAGLVARYLAIGGAAGLVLTQGRREKNPIKRLLSGLLSLYGVSGYMSDALSYSRLLALGMAGGVIGMVINDMGRRLFAIPFLGWILTIALLVVGHLLNLLINLISAYVHSSRLQYVEFFTKFLEAGGKPFKPLSERHRFLVVQPDVATPSKK
jgi:V/A-type H+-transporting ATPase subunit I